MTKGGFRPKPTPIFTDKKGSDLKVGANGTPAGQVQGLLKRKHIVKATNDILKPPDPNDKTNILA